METGVLHTHHLIVVVYILFIALNFIIVLLKRRNALLAIKARTRIIRIGWEVLLLGTGIFLMLKSPLGLADYILVKWITMSLGIVFFILGMKKMNALWMTLSLVMFIYTYLLGSTRNILLKPEEMRVHEAYLTETDEALQGKAIYEIACARCHGEDGKSNYRKAKKLAETSLNDDAKATFIKMGKGIMPSYSYMKDEEIQVLLKYLNQLKENSTR